ncbi:hypothetical protein EG329_012927 [Mollisiaceae sp. DMI_Dod_QoI]|nr:hypothetical protein EG329_012927 [Helotiales sp. DMI_Dod_QoI]
MTLHTINPGVLGAAAATSAENQRHNHNQSTKGKIIGIVVGAVVLIAIIVFAVCYDRSRKRKARQGTKLRETGAEEMDEEAKPMFQQPEIVGMPRPLMMQPGGKYFPPTEQGMYAGSGYGPQPVPYAPGPMEAGHQGTDFYRNQ